MVNLYSAYGGVCMQNHFKHYEGTSENRIATALEMYDGKQYCSGLVCINDALELYNICLCIEEYMNGDISDQDKNRVQGIYRSSLGNIGRYVNTIGDDNIESQTKEVHWAYKDDYFHLLCHHRIFNRLSSSVFVTLLSNGCFHLKRVLAHRPIVEQFDAEIADYMRTSSESAEIIAQSLWGQKPSNINLPKSLTNAEKYSILERYTELDISQVNPSVLGLIQTSRNVDGFITTDELKLKAKETCSAFWEAALKQHAGFTYGTEICFDGELAEDAPPSGALEGHTVKLTYATAWFKENLDFPTLLNNFIYLFEYTDILFRCNFVATNSKLGTLEAVFQSFSDGEYQNGFVVRVEQQTALAQMMTYHRFLQQNGILLEDVFQWFFTTYLKEEFHVDDFFFFAPSANTTMLEKCKLLAVSIDEILKQYQLWHKHGSINPALLSISSSTNKLTDYLSREEQKYAYASSAAISSEMSLLFAESTFYRSDDTLMEEPLYKYLQSNSLFVDDVAEWQRQRITFLLEQGSISLGDDSKIIINERRTHILRDLYKNDVLCTVYCQKYQDILSDLHQKGHIEYEGTLFTRQEQALLDFKLNKASFINGEDLRNKYVHGSYPRDEKQQEQDYYNFLIIITLIIIKINEELCLADEQDEA